MSRLCDHGCWNDDGHECSGCVRCCAAVIAREKGRFDAIFAAEMELETAKRVVDGCQHPAPHPFYGACAPCIAAYAKQLRANQRAMREALEREQKTHVMWGERIEFTRRGLTALIESIRASTVLGKLSDDDSKQLCATLSDFVQRLEGK